MSTIINADTSNGLKLTSDTSGEIELQANGVTKAKITANGLQDNNGNSLRGGMYRNFIINGDMRIDQRNGGASVTPSNSYALDRWTFATSVASKFTAQQSTTATDIFKNSLLITSSSAYSVGSSDILALQQKIEGYNIANLNWGTASASTVTLSFWVRSSLTGTFGGSISNSGYTRSYPFSYTISSADTWEKKTITIAGDTTGSWSTDNSTGMRVIFGIGVGSTYSGTSGAWTGSELYSSTGATSVVGTSGATLYITGVQLEVGEGASDFEFLPYDVQLRRCQRYYEVSGTGTNFGSNLCVAQNTTRANCGSAYPVAKRATPTVSIYSASGVNTVVAPGLSAVTVTAITSHNIYGIQFIAGAFVSSRPYLFYYIANSEL